MTARKVVLCAFCRLCFFFNFSASVDSSVDVLVPRDILPLWQSSTCLSFVCYFLIVTSCRVYFRVGCHTWWHSQRNCRCMFWSVYLKCRAVVQISLANFFQQQFSLVLAKHSLILCRPWDWHHAPFAEHHSGVFCCVVGCDAVGCRAWLVRMFASEILLSWVKQYLWTTKAEPEVKWNTLQGRRNNSDNFFCLQFVGHGDNGEGRKLRATRDAGWISDQNQRWKVSGSDTTHSRVHLQTRQRQSSWYLCLTGWAFACFLTFQGIRCKNCVYHHSCQTTLSVTMAAAASRFSLGPMPVERASIWSR